MYKKERSEKPKDTSNRKLHGDGIYEPFPAEALLWSDLGTEPRVQRAGQRERTICSVLKDDSLGERSHFQ